jgi:hypothetical protein
MQKNPTRAPVTALLLKYREIGLMAILAILVLLGG